MAQRLLHHQEHALLVGGAGMYHPIGVQAGAGQAGGEQVIGGGAPQHAAAHARQDSGREQRGAGARHRVRPAAFHLVQRAAGQAAFGQMRVESRHAEAYGLAWAGCRALQHADASAQAVQVCNGRLEGEHVRILFLLAARRQVCLAGSARLSHPLWR